MGYISHHGIIVTSFDEQSIQAARNEAIKIFGENKKYKDLRITGMVSEIIVSPVNSYHTFFIGPDGSKEGWDASQEGDAKRGMFTAFMQDNKETLYLQWAEIRYQDGNNDVAIESYSGE